MSAEVLILDTVRTPVGRHGGALAGSRPDDLAAHVLRELVARQPDLEPVAVDDVVLGNGNGPGRRTGTWPGWRRCWPACRPACPG